MKRGGAVLYREELERAMRALARYVLDYRLVAREDMVAGAPRGVVALQILPTPLLRARSDAERFLADAFAAELYVTPTRTLADLLRKGTFASLEVVFVGSFPPQAKAVKLKKG